MPDFFAPDMRRCYISSEEIWREITAYAFKLAMFRKFENIKSKAFSARRSRGDRTYRYNVKPLNTSSAPELHAVILQSPEAARFTNN
jgi:hypothetical protein